MRATHVLDRAPSAGVSLRRRPDKVIALRALLRAPSLDRQLAAGVPTWALLADGGGPCFIRSRTDALTDPLREVSRWLSVAN